jgi:hypothetical protein
MEFRLTYEGALYSETNRSGEVRRARADHKHELRKAFHPQLKRLWATHVALDGGDTDGPSLLMDSGPPGWVDPPLHTVESLSERFSRFGYKFVPLVTRELSLLCSVDILYLRHDPPGAILRHGDIDNRLKVLFDALQVPREATQVGKYATPDQEEDPFFCLLEDDSVISRVSVETDTLLEAINGVDETNAARLVLTVKIKPQHFSIYNWNFS